jgi:glucose/arabinose dehydrogenase
VKRSSKAAVVALSAAGLFTGLAVPGSAAWAADGVDVVATGFAGPLHVAVAPGGDVLVADAFAGAIDRVHPATGAVSEVVAAPGFSPGVDVLGGQVYFTISEGTEEETTSTSLMRWTQDSGTTQVADLLAWELANNPDGQPQGTGEDADSNPYGVLALPGRVLVADAAGNDIVEIRANGTVRTLTVFPNSFAGECATRTNNGVPDGGCDPTPTDLKLGPDGFLYVSGLGGEAEGHIWKVNATTGAILEHHGGFPPLTGIAVANDGTLFVASLFTSQVFRLNQGTTSVADVPGPSGLDIGNGTLYAGSVDFSGGPGSLVSIAPSAFHAP